MDKKIIPKVKFSSLDLEVTDIDGDEGHVILMTNGNIEFNDICTLSLATLKKVVAEAEAFQLFLGGNKELPCGRGKAMFACRDCGSYDMCDIAEPKSKHQKPSKKAKEKKKEERWTDGVDEDGRCLTGIVPPRTKRGRPKKATK